MDELGVIGNAGAEEEEDGPKVVGKMGLPSFSRVRRRRTTVEKVVGRVNLVGKARDDGEELGIVEAREVKTVDDFNAEVSGESKVERVLEVAGAKDRESHSCECERSERRDCIIKKYRDI